MNAFLNTHDLKVEPRKSSETTSCQASVQTLTLSREKKTHCQDPAFSNLSKTNQAKGNSIAVKYKEAKPQRCSWPPALRHLLRGVGLRGLPVSPYAVRGLAWAPGSKPLGLDLEGAEAQTATAQGGLDIPDCLRTARLGIPRRPGLEGRAPGGGAGRGRSNGFIYLFIFKAQPVTQQESGPVLSRNTHVLSIFFLYGKEKKKKSQYFI